MREQAQRLTEDYTLRCLSADYHFSAAEHSRDENRFWPALAPPSNFFTRHLFQLYWTLTRAFGLGKLHEARDAGHDDEEIFRQHTIVDNGVRHARSFTPWVRSTSPLKARPRLLIDVTATFLLGQRTGIQRVVREVVKFADLKGTAIPIVLDRNAVFMADIAEGTLHPCEIVEGDRLLLLDSTWFLCISNILVATHLVKRRGGSVVACVYDLIPLQYPLLCTKDIARNFSKNFHLLAPEVDGFIAISASVADDLRDYLAAHISLAVASKPIEQWHLGADLPDDNAAEATVQPAVRSLAQKSFFVCVGTVEPRKGHPIALDAFDALWAKGIDATLVIMGGRGWTMDAFEHRLATHPERDRRLFRFDRVSDADLAFAYANAQALVMPTLAEGFGLPTIEAALLGASVIASDIPIMREIGGDSFYYFDLLDPVSLAATVMQFLGIPASERLVLRKIHTWEQSCTRVMAIAEEMTTALRSDGARQRHLL